MLLFEYGLVVTELPHSKQDVLHESSHKEYEARLECLIQLVMVSKQFSGRSFSFTVRDVAVEEFKNDITSSKTIGKKIDKVMFTLKVK